MTAERSGGDSLLAMSAWHELVERDHDLQNPTSVEKIRLVGLYLRLGSQTTVLDVACGKAGPALILAQEFGCRIHGGGTSATLLLRSRRPSAEAVQSLSANRSGESPVATKTDSSTCRRRWRASRRPVST